MSYDTAKACAVVDETGGPLSTDGTSSISNLNNAHHSSSNYNNNKDHQLQNYHHNSGYDLNQDQNSFRGKNDTFIIYLLHDVIKYSYKNAVILKNLFQLFVVPPDMIFQLMPWSEISMLTFN